MIITIPLIDEPFHDDPEWGNWQATWKWIGSNGDLDYFLHQLTAEPELRRRFSRFVAAAQQSERKLQNELERIAETCDIRNQPLPVSQPGEGEPMPLHLSLEIHPSAHLHFSQMFGNWKEFQTTMLEEHQTLESFLLRLQSSLETRREVLQFLQDATRFEEAVSWQFQESINKDP